MGIDGVENLTEGDDSPGTEPSPEPQPGADDPTPTTDPSVPGDDPVQQEFETPTAPDSETDENSTEPEDVE